MTPKPKKPKDPNVIVLEPVTVIRIAEDGTSEMTEGLWPITQLPEEPEETS